MQWTAGPWESMISSWGSWGVPGGWIPLGHPWCPPGTSLSSWLDFRGVPLIRWTQSSWNTCRLRQRSWPRSLPSRGSGTSKHFRWAKSALCSGGLLSHCPETPAWICAQGSHHALPRSGGEPASTDFGGGRSSLGVAVSRKSIVHIRGPHPELQKLWAALCLLRRSAEREGCLQAEVGPLDSGCHRLGVPIPRWAMPMGWVLLPPMRWCTAPLWQTSVELRVGRHRAPSQDSTVSTLSQFLPVCWVTGKWREELAGVTLAAPFPLTRGYERLFFSFSSVPRTANPGGVPPAPPAVRLGGAVWRQAQYCC